MKMDTEAIFETIWERYIVPLEGQDIPLVRVKNKILVVDNEGITRLTSSGNPKNQIKKERLKNAVVTLLAQGSLCRQELQPSKYRDSSGVLGILRQVPFFEGTAEELKVNTTRMREALFRHCEEPKATKQSSFTPSGLLRSARNDESQSKRDYL